MKRNIKLVFIVMISLLMLLPSTVRAEEQVTWNENIKTESFDLNISDIKLAIYTLEEVEIEDTEDDGVTTSGSYQEKKLYKTVQLSKDIHKINPTHLYYPGKETEDGKEGNTTLVKLGLDLTSDQIKQYVKSAIPTEGAEDNYFIEIIIDFKLNKYPEYKNVYRVNIYESLIATIKGETTAVKYDPTKIISIPVNSATYSTENGTETVEYLTELKEDEEEFIALFTSAWYLMFSDQECEDTACSNIDAGDAILFTTITNFEKLADDSEELEDEIEDKIEELTPQKPQETPPKSEVVEVDDTAESFPVVIYLTGVVIILLGSLIIYKVLNKKSKKEETKE